MNFSRTIIVYRDTLLPSSETFIRAQAESLSRFSPIYVCLRRTSGLSLPESRVHPLCGTGIVGKAQRARFKFLGASRTQQKALARQKPILFHAHFGPDACDVITLVRALNVPLVVSLHGYDVNASDDRLPLLYLRRRDLLKAEAARFLCISDFIRTQALAKGFPAERTVVHYTGIDTELFSPDPNVPRIPVVLFVGRVAFGKGCEYLIRAMSEVQKVMPEARLVVIGEGPQRQELEQEAATLLRNFEFLGVQTPTVVKNWMNRAMVFCSPSFTTAIDQEGFGMAFVEAQAMGLPVVSSLIGGIPEAVADRRTGLLVPEKNSEALAAALLILLRNKAMWTTFSQAGRDRVAARFDIRRQATLLEDIYENVLTERTSNAGAEEGQNRQRSSSYISAQA